MKIARLLRHKALTPVVAALALTGLALAPSAFAAGDPIASGALTIDPSGALGRQLDRHDVHLRAGSFAIGSGSIDPTTGAGSLRLRGAIVFKHAGKRLRLRDLVVTLSPKGGWLRSGHTRLLALKGGSVTRSGFGAKVRGISLRLPARFARKLRKAFDLRSLRPGSAGVAALSEQPATVQILSGAATVTPATGPGSIASKLAAHCIDPDTGVSPIAPASQPDGPGTTYFYPVAFGTISPSGGAGVIQQSGGTRIANGGSGLPGGCSTSNTVTIAMTDLSIDLAAQVAAAHVSVTGSGSPFGDFNGGISFPIDAGSTLVSADPATLAVAASGTRIKLDSVAAMFMDKFFPQPDPADPSMEFAAGDAFGTATLSVHVR